MTMSGGHDLLPLTMRIQAGRSATVVQVAGVVDFATAPMLRAVLFDLLDDGPTTLLMDLADVTLLDGHSVGLLVAVDRQATARGAGLRLRGPTGRVLRALAH